MRKKLLMDLVDRINRQHLQKMRFIGAGHFGKGMTNKRYITMSELLIYTAAWALTIGAFVSISYSGGNLLTFPLFIILPGPVIGASLGFIVFGRSSIWTCACVGELVWLFILLSPAFQTPRE